MPKPAAAPNKERDASNFDFRTVAMLTIMATRPDLLHEYVGSASTADRGASPAPHDHASHDHGASPEHGTAPAPEDYGAPPAPHDHGAHDHSTDHGPDHPAPRTSTDPAEWPTLLEIGLPVHLLKQFQYIFQRQDVRGALQTYPYRVPNHGGD